MLGPTTISAPPLPHSIGSTVSMSARRPPRPPKPEKIKSPSGSNSTGFGGQRKELTWRCAEGCGACCKLDKDSTFLSPEEILQDPKDVELYRSMVGSDGWCIHFDKSTRKCGIYADRPFFCRVEADVFKSLYGVGMKRFNKEACSCCRDTIKAVYGYQSEELENFERSLRTLSCCRT